MKETLLSPNFWPKDTIIRKFYKRRINNLSSENQNNFSDVGNNGQPNTQNV